MHGADHEFRTLEEAWMRAVQRKDLLALDAMLAPDYVYTASGQGRWSRQQWLETVAVYDLNHFTFLDVETRLYGDVAVVLARYRQEARVAGAVRGGDFLITDVWVNRDGRWQVAARSSIMMTKGSSPS